MANLFKKTKVADKVDSNIQKFTFPTNISMKSVGDSIEGTYQGCLIKMGEGINGADLILAAFMQEDGSIYTCVAGSQLLKFLENFNQGYYLKVQRTDTIKISNDRKFAQYSFEPDMNGIKEENEIIFIDASTIPKPKQLNE